MVFPAHVWGARRQTKVFVFVRGKLFPPLTLLFSLSLSLSLCDIPGRLFFRPEWTTDTGLAATPEHNKSNKSDKTAMAL